jgi:hypothetical protein
LLAGLTDLKEKTMGNRLKQYFWIGLALAVFYFLLSHHIIFSSFKDFDLLKKQELSMEYTFFSLKQAKAVDVLRIDALRDAGIEDILLDRGIVDEEELDRILFEIDSRKERE